jgi:site-specific recombinase XerD
LSEHFDRSPDQLQPEDLRQYFVHLKTERRFSRPSSTEALCAVKLFWEKTLQRSWPAELAFARATPQTKLPVILSADEVRRILPPSRPRSCSPVTTAVYAHLTSLCRTSTRSDSTP